LADLASLPEPQLFYDFDLTKESIKESSIEEFLGKCALLVAADVTAFMMLLES